MPQTTAAPRTATPAAPPAHAARLIGVEVRLGDHPALHATDLSLERASLTVLGGPNGAGKSTLLEVLAGVRRPGVGRVEVTATSTAFVPQRADVPATLPVTVREVVTMGAWGEAGAWRPVGRERRRRVEAALGLLGLTGLAGRSFATLSGGERQRTLLAQGLARGADLLLLDEPTTGLDAASAGHVCAAVDEQVTRGTTVVCVSHDPVVIDRAHRVVRLEEGRVVADAAGRDGSRGD